MMFVKNFGRGPVGLGRLIAVINSDPEAHIFEEVDLRMVDELFPVLETHVESFDLHRGA